MEQITNIQNPIVPPAGRSAEAVRGLFILIVDDHPMVVEGLKSALSNTEGISVAGTASNAFDALEFLKSNAVDVAFLDINLPDVSGIDLCKKITSQFPNVKCLALSTFNERSYISRMIQSGAVGYLIKSSTKEEIMEAIRQVMSGGMYMNVSFQDPPVKSTKALPFLTRREKEVLNLIAEGMTNPQIAEKIFVSVLTVNSHRKNLLSKFEVSNTASLIKVAAQHGLL